MRIYENTPEMSQGSLNWLAIRAGVVTASEAKALFTPKWAISEGKGVETYLSEKLAEKWLGASLPSFTSKAMEDGHIIEKQARDSYQFDYGEKIRQVSFVASDDLTVGCSPDGLIGDGKGFELKCPQADTHVKYLLANKVPDEYIVQVHFSMFVTGYDQWVFMSYRDQFPDFIKVVQRDEKIIETIEDGVADFLRKFDTAYKCLVELNGGVAPEPNSFREAALKMEGPAKVEQPPQPIGNDLNATA